MHLITEAKYLFGYTVLLTFNDGSIRVFDFEPELRGEVMIPLKDAEYFRQFFLDCGTLCWPNDVDFCPDSLYEHAVPVEQAFKKGA
jgi:hypothetical protein